MGGEEVVAGHAALKEQTPEEAEASIQKAKEEGKLRVIEARSGIKLPPGAPKIVVAIPMGDKDDPDLFQCPKCNHRHFGVVVCEKCGKPHDARYKLRSAGMVPIEWAMNSQQIVPPLLCSQVIMARKSVLSAQARNEMTIEAVKMGAKYIFYWDDDTIIPPKALYDLHNMMEIHPDIAVLSGVYTTREECPEPIVYKEHGQGSFWDFSGDPGVIEDIFAAGAGCLMARVEALEEVQKILGGPWWHDEHDMDKFEKTGHRTLWGHDIRFCKRIHDARETGKTSKQWRVCLAGWIQCFHFDIRAQKMYGLPKEAPCFSNNNTEGYWNKVWSDEGYDQRNAYLKLYGEITKEIPQFAKVVDLGCGPGMLMDMIAKRCQAACYGYDISPEAIQMVKDRFLDGEVLDAKDFKLNHFPAKNTILVSTETLEHLSDDRYGVVLEQAKKAKKAIFSVPEGETPGTPKGEHLRIFTEKSFRKDLKHRFAHVSIRKIEPHYLMAVCSNEGKGK